MQQQCPGVTSYALAVVLTVCTGYCSVACRAIGVAQTNVNQLGATSGWYSDDTRDDDGTLLNGLTKSYPG